MTLHQEVQNQILDICQKQGFSAQMEYRGAGWRADVLAAKGSEKYAFEVQMSPQTLKKTQERQEKYQRDGINGCWLFEKEPAKFRQELATLPIFRIEKKNDELFVSLQKRKILSLENFVEDFLQGKIKFCHVLTPLKKIEIIFLEMKCWKCGTVNHVFYVGPLRSACNTLIKYEETLWASDKLVFNPEIINAVQQYAASEKGTHLKLATVKSRYSHTIGEAYISFGCSKCDSIFGDFYVQQAVIDSWYGDRIVDRLNIDINFEMGIKCDIPHWCHPGNHDFCE